MDATQRDFQTLVVLYTLYNYYIKLKHFDVRDELSQAT